MRLGSVAGASGLGLSPPRRDILYQFSPQFDTTDLYDPFLTVFSLTQG